MAEIRDIEDLGYEEVLRDTYNSLLERIESDSFDIVSIKNYFMHIPIKDVNLGWSDNVYAIAEKCHRRMYEHCKNKSFLGEGVSYEDYLKGALFLN